ncbi:hypothetical protein [Niallia circulans]|uniref:hypothetical protein n=1 Tax=Niallia circulans TaxID=1397 RepID=UPI0013DE4763|nr:hypothetical protein [Niallia circulans]
MFRGNAPFFGIKVERGTVKGKRRDESGKVRGTTAYKRTYAEGKLKNSQDN